MVEYDFVAADKKQDEATADADSSNYVLCKVYRSPRAKGKSASASASSSSKNASSKHTAKKRKAGGGDHPEVPPAKSIQQQEQVQQDTAAFYQPQGVESEHGGDFIFNIEDINFYVDKSMLRDEPEQGLQQPIAEPETAVQGQRGAQSEHEEFITR
jgi:outer membrane protein OmpA-like peptidoglycan-associated protein